MTFNTQPVGDSGNNPISQSVDNLQTQKQTTEYVSASTEGGVVDVGSSSLVQNRSPSKRRQKRCKSEAKYVV